MLRKRVVTALWGVPLIIAAVWFDEPLPWFTLLVALWGLLAVLEFYRITAVSKSWSLAIFGIIWTLLFILCPQFDWSFWILLASAIVISLSLTLFQHKRAAFISWVWSLAGVLYVGWLLSFLVLLRLEAGREWVFLAILATFGSDTAAYFIGRAWGRHRMAPRISPGKTWEGAIAGLFGAIIISLLFTLPAPWRLPLGFGEAVLLGVLISVFGQIGDLLESWIKRRGGVKDSGSLMPGHGGLLDRMDSILLAGVVVSLYYMFFIA